MVKVLSLQTSLLCIGEGSVAVAVGVAVAAAVGVIGCSAIICTQFNYYENISKTHLNSVQPI